MKGKKQGVDMKSLIVPSGLLAMCVAVPWVSAPVVPASPSWEYAQFMVAPKIPLFTWNSPTQSIDKITGYDLYVALGGTVRKESYNNVALLNVVGAAGWELATVQDDGGGPLFLFKRPTAGK